jgi:hypothetical protein
MGASTLDVSPAGDRGFRNYVNIEESAVEPIAVGLPSVIKRHLHRRYVTGVCTVIVWIERMPFLIPVHGTSLKRIRSEPPLENLWQAVQKWV